MTNKEYIPSVEPWALGEDLLEDTQNARNFIDTRHNVSASTQRGVNQRLGQVATKYTDIRAFVVSPIANAETPGRDTAHFKHVEGVVTLKDLHYGEYMKNERGTAIGLQAVAAFRDDMFDSLPFAMKRSIIDNGGLVNLPIDSHLKISYLPDLSSSITTPEDTLDQSTEPFEYMSYVRSVDALCNDLTEDSHPAARNIAALRLIEDMNYRHALVGNHVEVTGPNLRRPNPHKDGKFLRHFGTTQGILRKFVVGPYVNGDGDLRNGVQAVIWQPENIAMLQNSLTTAKDIDESSDTTFVPLMEPHSIVSIQSN